MSGAVLLLLCLLLSAAASYFLKLGAMAAGDRVQLMAVDLNAIALTKTFVDPKSKEMADALAQLKARVPLGATDI